MHIEKLIGRLKERKPQFAIEALSKAGPRDAFEFGRLSGIFQGLQMVEEMIDEILGEDDAHSVSKNLR